MPTLDAFVKRLTRRSLYRVDYFRNMIAGNFHIGKEYFRAEDITDAKRQAKIRAVPLGLVTDVHLAE